jgi:hypothetical protein
MYLDALNWIRTTYPYWNASNGADHLWLFAHDEGACWAPTEIYNSSIILSQWGRLAQPAYKSKNGPVTESLTSRWGPVAALVSGRALLLPCWQAMYCDQCQQAQWHSQDSGLER